LNNYTKKILRDLIKTNSFAHDPSNDIN
jgi:hypothetical protein